jgi:protein TonB
MWENSLIESSVYGRAARPRWTIPVAAFLHIFIDVVAVFFSYWHVDALDAPPGRLQYFTSIPVSFSPPPQLGRRHSEEMASKTRSRDLTQNVQPAIDLREDKQNQSSEFFVSNEDVPGESTLPVGVPWGVEGGDPVSNSANGAGEGTPDSEEPQVFSLNMVQPVLIRRVEPEYPRAALVTHLEGVVILQAMITKSGSVEQVKTLRADDPLLEKAAKDAVMQWKYQPATLQGRPVKVYFNVTVIFHMK